MRTPPEAVREGSRSRRHPAPARQGSAPAACRPSPVPPIRVRGEPSPREEWAGRGQAAMRPTEASSTSEAPKPLAPSRAALRVTYPARAGPPRGERAVDPSPARGPRSEINRPGVRAFVRAGPCESVSVRVSPCSSLPEPRRAKCDKDFIALSSLAAASIFREISCLNQNLPLLRLCGLAPSRAT